MKIKSAIQIVLHQFPVGFYGSELMNTNGDGLSFNFLPATRKFIKSPASLFFRRIHRRNLIDFTAQACECGFNLRFTPGTTRRGVFALVGIGYAIASDVTGVRGKAEPYNRVVFLFTPAQELRQARGPTDNHNQYPGSKGIQSACVANATFVQYVPDTRHDIV